MNNSYNLHTDEIRSMNLTDLKCIAKFSLSILIAMLSIKLTFITILNTFFLEKHIPLTEIYRNLPDLDYARYFSSLFLAPIIETMIFIVLVHLAMNKFFKSDISFIATSALFFGAYHYPSGGWFSVVITTIAGAILAYAYKYFLKKLFKDHAAFAVMFIHMLYNLALILIYRIGN